MKKLLDRMELSWRMLCCSEKAFIAGYLSLQLEELQHICEGKPYVLCTYYVPSELTAMFQVPFIYIERIVGLAVSCNRLEKGRKAVLPGASCSYQRAFMDMIESGILPKPKLILSLKYPCWDGMVLCRTLHNRYGIVLYEMPGKDYEKEFESCYRLLKEYFPLQQNIRDTVELSNEAVSLKQKIDIMRIKYPGILKSDDILKIFTIENTFGSRGAVEVLRQLLSYVENLRKDYRDRKKFPIFWMGLIPLYDNNVLMAMEEQLDCTFVYEEMWMFGNCYLTEETFFRDIAGKLRNSLFYNLDRRVERLIGQCRTLDVRLVIHFSQEKCSFLPPQVTRIRTELEKEEITFAHLKADVVQGGFQRNLLEETIKNKMNRIRTNDS